MGLAWSDTRHSLNPDEQKCPLESLSSSLYGSGLDILSHLFGPKDQDEDGEVIEVLYPVLSKLSKFYPSHRSFYISYKLLSLYVVFS